MRTIAQRIRGFGLLELFIVVATIALTILFTIPMLMRPRKHGCRISCSSQLKQIGLSFRLFSNDHNDAFPFAVSATDGGTREFTNSPQVFLHFQAMSNELVTPKVLVCNADSKTQRALDFFNANTDSFNSNSNLSYFVSFDADESKPERLLAGDRNITGGSFTSGFLRLLKTNSPAGWANGTHDYGGTIGLSDGSASQMTAQQLQQQLQKNSLPAIRLAIP